MTARITTVIPTRGFGPLLDVCLDRLAGALAAAGPSLVPTTVVVDNATPFPLAVERAPGEAVRVLRFDRHHAFAACCNAAVAAAPGDLVLLLNNDVLLHPQSIVAMRRALDADPLAGICGARLLFPDGRLQHAGVVFGPGPAGPYHVDRGREAALISRAARRFQAVTGACMLIRAEVWRALGGLDESYPFGLEDIDFCLRAGRAGWAVVCAQDVDSLHFESMTPGREALDEPSRALFMARWAGRYAVDGDAA